jgi:hypothetical protein
LPDQFVLIFNVTFLPGGIWMREKEFGFQLLSNILVVSELFSVVSGYGMNKIGIRPS